MIVAHYFLHGFQVRLKALLGVIEIHLNYNYRHHHNEAHDLKTFALYTPEPVGHCLIIGQYSQLI